MSGETPREADFGETIVRQQWNFDDRTPYWIVRVHKHAAYVFSPSSETPGWLAGLRFLSYESAAAFAVSLKQPIRWAMDGHRQMCDGARQAIDAISSEQSRQHTVPPVSSVLPVGGLEK